MAGGKAPDVAMVKLQQQAQLVEMGALEPIDPLVAFRAVRGRDADPAPLLRRRGLVTTSPGLDRGEGSAPS